MKQENTNKERDMKKVGLVIAATAGTVCTVGLGVLCYMKTKDIKQLKIDKKKLELDLDIFKEAYEGVVFKLEEKENSTELVKNVVGGPLIDRLIKNENKVLSRLKNKKNTILKNGLDEAAKKVIEDLDDRIQNSMETIADFVSVKDALK